MQPSAIEDAARLLFEARRNRRPLAALPEPLQPATFAEAAAVQQALVKLLGETVSAWKVAGATPESAMWGAVIASRRVASPARFAAADMPLLGVEAEIAFRLEEDVTAADRTITEEEFDARTSILPAIEIVDTRFQSYRDTPVLHRAADFMSNGALVCGQAAEAASRSDLPRLAVRLEIGGKLVCDTIGGHATGDPRIPALAFLRAPGRPDVLPAGTVITAGTYTGLLYAQPGDEVVARFEGIGEVRVHFAP